MKNEAYWGGCIGFVMGDFRIHFANNPPLFFPFISAINSPKNSAAALQILSLDLMSFNSDASKASLTISILSFSNCRLGFGGCALLSSS